MRVVVVGGSGNVGSALLGRLGAEPDVERVGVSRRAPEPAEPFDGVAWHALDVADPASGERLRAALAGADAVVHLAWLLQPNHDEAVMRRTNVGGLAAVLEAATDAGVPHVVVASSVGAYSPGPKRRVDESWPTDGVRSSHYARHKAENERLLDRFERAHPQVAIARLRPGLVMQAAAGRELDRLFLGPLVPTSLLAPVRVPLLPLPPRLVSQAVHADDLADAILRILRARATGPFNIAADPVIGPRQLARILRGRWLPVPAWAMRALLLGAWRAHLVRADPGWLDLATGVPLMSTARIRAELGWRPRIAADDAVRETIAAVGRHRSLGASPQLH
ncbi:NAD-dependent epimerase/dehydratase family protein [Amnibacterium kyonggiense]|uniref:Nucleoside-diphosphate-sugar epimerase n=1 Tax=Amnibacterium kyonggiense TaxID=595671 RepID=A0A4R7FDP5_9MICO|nr:NAD-dependent epimerase/dehydratase family protein [Amnibacterium kyonggiense]TDS75095.1 nucleoside-diphosphate-sugar epimerase [Amnibacterium kyonggiense]